MITHERLKELIEQGAIIWHNDWEEIKLDKKNCEVCEVRSMNGELITWYLCFEYKYDDRKYWEEIDIQELEEDVEKGKWELEFGCVERTVNLDLPKWEDIEKDKKFHYIRHFVLSKNFSFFIEIYKFTNTIGVSWSGGCKKTDPRFDRTWELTKENYFEACRKAKELFLGEEE